MYSWDQPGMNTQNFMVDLFNFAAIIFPRICTIYDVTWPFFTSRIFEAISAPTDGVNFPLDTALKRMSDTSISILDLVFIKICGGCKASQIMALSRSDRFSVFCGGEMPGTCKC